MKTYPKSNYKEIRAQLKKELKSLIADHTALKKQKDYSLYQGVRIRHIAYSMFKGHTFESIEASWKEPKSHINTWIKRSALALYEDYMKRIVVAQDACEECVCGACENEATADV